MNDTKQTCRDLVGEKFDEVLEEIGNALARGRVVDWLNEDTLGIWSTGYDGEEPVEGGQNIDLDGWYSQLDLSYGGPADMLRFHHEENGDLLSVEYRYHDWFDGAGIDVTSYTEIGGLADEMEDLGLFVAPSDESE